MAGLTNDVYIKKSQYVMDVVRVIIIIIIKRIFIQDVHFNELKTVVINVCPVPYALNLQLKTNLIKVIIQIYKKHI